jgi:hypothetical protein
MRATLRSAVVYLLDERLTCVHLERLSGLSLREAIKCLPAAEAGARKVRHAALGKSPKRKVRALTRLS